MWRVAASWLGWDPETGRESGLRPPGFGEDEWRASVASPRVYGFHATLKPPFHLAEGTSLDALHDELTCFAASQRCFEAGPLFLSEIGRFLALTISRQEGPLQRLAEECVREFDFFRRPPSEAELARRRQAALTQRELELLSEWGYPYVLDRWRFHMTLTGSITDDALRQRLRRYLETDLADFVGQHLTFDSLCLFEQPQAGQPFVLRHRFPFGGSR